MDKACTLCGLSSGGSNSDLTLLKSKAHLEALAFLKGLPVGTNRPTKSWICGGCHFKIDLVSKVKADVVDMDAGAGEDKSVEDDVDLEEMDQLSLFYAEQEDNGDDPDFKPNKNAAGQRNSKRPVAKPVPPNLAIKCQFCHSVFTSSLLLKNHLNDTHLTEEGEGSNCGQCHEEFSSRQSLVSHIIEASCYSNASKKVPAVGSGNSATADLQTAKVSQCDVCHRSFRRLSSLRSHRKRCRPDGLSSSQCGVCHKTVGPGRLNAHYAFEHVCKRCTAHLELPLKPGDEAHAQLFANRKEKCKHLHEVHNMAKKSSGPKNVKTSRHQQNQESSKKFKCSECPASYNVLSYLRKHQSRRHPSEAREMIKCPYCPYEVTPWQRHALDNKHIPRVHPEKAGDLIKHHKEKREAWKLDYAARAKVQCLECDYASSKGSHLKRHYVDVHGFSFVAAAVGVDGDDGDREPVDDPDNPDGHLCPECGQHYRNRLVLVQHMLKKHSTPKGEQCPYCDFRYPDLTEHINRRHSDVVGSSAPYTCPHCGKKMKSRPSLKVHIRNIHGPKNKTDKTCSDDSSAQAVIEINGEESNDGVSRVKAKRKHAAIHLAGICPYCELKFADLLGHIRHNHEKDKDKEQNPKALECQLCQETFKSVRELLTHRQLHPQFANHVCGKCSSEFETVVEVRHHRLNLCPKKRKRPRPSQSGPGSGGLSAGQALSGTQDQEKVGAESGGGPRGSNDLPQWSALLQMASELDDDDGAVANKLDEGRPDAVPPSSKPSKPVIDNEGRGTVACFICKKAYFIKSKLKQHYVAAHEYDPAKINDQPKQSLKGGQDENLLSCCDEKFANLHARIKHQLDLHSRISGNICPYCDNKWCWRKYDDLDSHVARFHSNKMNSKIQSCRSCKATFDSYEALKRHRQMHESGNRVRLVQITQGQNEVVSVNVKVATRKEVENRGGVKCQLCSVFKMRKDQLKVHYEKWHGYQPKLAEPSKRKKRSIVEPASEAAGVDDLLAVPLVCPTCSEAFSDNNVLIRHLLREHCVYSGMICPYCTGHHPKRYVDLQAHVTADHMDKLTGYDVTNTCKVCKVHFHGYAELRDHVQQHGDMFREPSANVERYKETARIKRQALKAKNKVKRAEVVQVVTKPHPVDNKVEQHVIKPDPIDLDDDGPGAEDPTIEMPQFPAQSQSDLEQMMSETLDEKMPDPPQTAFSVSDAKPIVQHRPSVIKPDCDLIVMAPVIDQSQLVTQVFSPDQNGSVTFEIPASVLTESGKLLAAVDSGKLLHATAAAKDDKLLRLPSPAVMVGHHNVTALTSSQMQATSVNSHNSILPQVADNSLTFDISASVLATSSMSTSKIIEAVDSTAKLLIRSDSKPVSPSTAAGLGAANVMTSTDSNNFSMAKLLNIGGGDRANIVTTAESPDKVLAAYSAPTSSADFTILTPHTSVVSNVYTVNSPTGVTAANSTVAQLAVPAESSSNNVVDCPTKLLWSYSAPSSSVVVTGSNRSNQAITQQLQPSAAPAKLASPAASEESPQPPSPSPSDFPHNLSSPGFSVAALLAAAELEEAFSVRSTNFNELSSLQTPEPPTPATPSIVYGESSEKL